MKSLFNWISVILLAAAGLLHLQTPDNAFLIASQLREIPVGEGGIVYLDGVFLIVGFFIIAFNYDFKRAIAAAFCLSFLPGILLKEVWRLFSFLI